MNPIEKALNDAKKGGWKPKKDWHFEDRSEFGVTNIIWELERCFLDRDFWSALGKARGWTPTGGTGRSYHDEYNAGGYPSMYDWQIKWHRFIDHLAEGRTTESFFEEIYKT